nr:DNA polymerase phi subunit [Hymenolepis microstoma]
MEPFYYLKVIAYFKIMRDFVLQKSNRAFLDIFWDVTDIDESKRAAAIKKLIKYLSTTTQDLQTHVTYALDRLSKGLRSSPTPECGCSIALISVLKHSKSISKESILTAFDKHVYSYNAADAKERSVTNRAKILCLYILAASGRLSELTAVDHSKIATCLKPLLNSERCLLFMGDVLSQVIPKMNPKFVDAYGDLISYIWDLAWQTKEPSASEVIFILRLQDCSVALKAINTNKRFDVNDKSMIKRVVNAVNNCLPSSEFERAAELISAFKHSSIFEKLWARISAPIDHADSSIAQRIQILKVVLALLSKLQTEEQLKIILSFRTLTFLRKQLSSSKLSSHEDVCSLLNNQISALKAYTSEDPDAKSDINEEAKIASKKAASLFKVITAKMPLFDISAAPRAPHLLSSLLDIASSELSDEYLKNSSRNLQRMFLYVKEDPENVFAIDRQRLHILDFLRQIVFCLASRPSFLVNFEFLCESVDFFLLVANSNAMPLDTSAPKVTSAVSVSGLTHLGRCLTLLIRRVPLRSEIREDSHHAKTCKQGLEILDQCIKHLIKTDLKVCSERFGSEDSVKSIVQRLEIAENMLKEDELGSVGHWIGILYATTTVYALTLHTDPSSLKEMSLLELLDDIFQAHRHRGISSNAMETDDEQQDSPEWSSVLTDAMLSLCVEPWRLLRDVASATFGRMVARNEIYIQPTFDVPLEVVFGLKKAEKEVKEAKPVCPLQLILSIADSKSNAAQQRIGVAGEEDESDGESEFDEDEDEHDHDDNKEEEDIGGFAELSDAEDLPEVEDEGIKAEEVSDEGEEFLTNDQIERQDEALVALFKANRASRIDAKLRKETIALLKLRSFDFLENLLIYSSDARLFLPTLHSVLQMAVTSSRKANRVQNKGDKGGYVPLARIVSILENLHSRSIASNEALCKSISQSDDALLPICLKAIFSVFKNAIPDDRMIKCLQTACDFLQFKKVTDQKCSEVLMKYLEEFLGEFLTKTHPSRAYQQLLIRLITSLPDMATSAKNIILQRLKSPTSESQSKSSLIYSKTTLLNLANSVTTALAAAKSPALSDWTLELSRTLIGLFINPLSTNALMKSKDFVAAVFNSLFSCFKSNKTVFDYLTADEILAVLTVDRSEIPKATRANHSRLVQLMHSLRNSSGNLSSVLDDLGSKKKQQKAEAKQERRQKRKAKALENAEKRKKANTGSG